MYTSLGLPKDKLYTRFQSPGALIYRIICLRRGSLGYTNAGLATNTRTGSAPCHAKIVSRALPAVAMPNKPLQQHEKDFTSPP